MNTFDEKAKCPKCGGVEIIAHYCNARPVCGWGWAGGKACGEDREIIHRECARCHYRWDERPLTYIQDMIKKAYEKGTSESLVFHNSKAVATVMYKPSENNHSKERSEGLKCINTLCKSYETTFDQNCSATTTHHEPYITLCPGYVPDKD